MDIVNAVCFLIILFYSLSLSHFSLNPIDHLILNKTHITALHKDHYDCSSSSHAAPHPVSHLLSRVSSESFI